MIEREFGEEYGLRPNTPLKCWTANYIFNSGGLGDFVNYAAATYWAAKNLPWVRGKIFAPRYLVPLLSDIHSVNPEWQIFPSEEFSKHKKDNMIGPDIFMDGVNISHQFLSCVGAHPVDVGFAYYIGMTPPPPDGLLPVLDYDRKTLPNELKLKKYIVLPVGNVHPARLASGRHLNPIIDHINKKGLTPVLLGKKDLLANGVQTTAFPDDINYHEALDLRDKTTIKEAACILQHAECVVGLDTGLLHLAALMKDSKIIFGVNITSVEHRKPRRNDGLDIIISLTSDDLKCIGCQSNLKSVKHKFDQCIYGDTLCIDLLFANKARRFTEAIDEICG